MTKLTPVTGTGKSITGTGYEEWKTEYLGDAISTITAPDADVNWVRLVHFSPGTPGANSVIGDVWYQGEIEGVRIYRQHEGIRSVYYAPPELVYRWCRAEWDRMVQRHGTAEAARVVLMQGTLMPREQGVVDISAYTRLVEVEGIDKFITLARADEWRIPNYPSDYAQVAWYLETARRYELPHVLMEIVAEGREIESVRRFSLDINSFWVHPVTGRLYAFTGAYHWIDLGEAYASVKEAQAQFRSYQCQSLSDDAAQAS